MANYYKIDLYRAIPRLEESLSFDEAIDWVQQGGNVWCKYHSDAKDLASEFPDYYRDNIHFDNWNRPGEKYTLEHYHVDTGKNHVHICFGHGINDHDPNDILIIE